MNLSWYFVCSHIISCLKNVEIYNIQIYCNDRPLSYSNLLLFGIHALDEINIPMCTYGI